jgi:uncharacterized protein YndB with AHSA1/START domain
MESNQVSNAPLVKEVLLDAPVDRVWKAITSRDEMKQWYFDIKEFRAEPGFEFQFTADNAGKKFVHLCKVKEVDINKKFSHTWTYETHPEAVTLVTWELFPEGDKTRLRLTHEGLEKLPQDADYARENFVKGWNHILGISLTNHVKTK